MVIWKICQPDVYLHLQLLLPFFFLTGHHAGVFLEPAPVAKSTHSCLHNDSGTAHTFSYSHLTLLKSFTRVV